MHNPAVVCTPRTPMAMAMGIGIAIVLGLVLACSRDEREAGASTVSQPSFRPAGTNADARPPAIPFDSATPRIVVRATASWPHDTAAYTQGLLFYRDRLLESIGREGRSEVREVGRTTGHVTRRTSLPARDFGEGLAAVGDRLYQLTWQGGRGYVYDAATLERVDSVSYDGEGWGLASDGRALYLSDGTSRIRVIDPAGFRVQRTIQVLEAGQPVWMLNELEWVHGELWANVYETNLVARIDPASGHITGWLDLGALLTPAERTSVANRGGVANGIAYDSVRNAVLFTGKLWPRTFEARP